MTDCDFKFSTTSAAKFSSKKFEKIFRALPYFKGSWLIYSPFISLVPKKDRIVEVTFRRDGIPKFTITLDMSDPAQFTMIRNGFSEPTTPFIFWSLINESDDFIDVGANFGFYSQIVSQKVGNTGRVIAIEPNKMPYRFLSQNGLTNVTALNNAAGQNSNERFKIKKPFYRQSTAGRFLPAKNGDIRSISLDDIYQDLKNPKIKFIKIDTEGAELLVLKGAEKILKDQQPFVIAEVVARYSEHFDYNIKNVSDFMKENGYEYFYNIDEQAGCVSRIDQLQEGQILFSPRALTKDDF